MTNGTRAEAAAGTELDRLERMLEAFGADKARWPADRRAGAEALLARQDASGAAARRLLAEARGLDRLLAASPAPADLTALADRIAATAGALPPAPAEIITLPAARRSDVRSKPSYGARSWTAAAVLAASLLVGVVVGPGTAGLPALREAVDAIGLGGYVDQLALAPLDDTGLQDEDVL